MGTTEMAVAFANIFMAKVETEMLNQSAFKPLTWKRYWTLNKEEILQFIKQANKQLNLRPDTNIYKGERFTSYLVLDVRTHFKPTETFMHFSLCHPPGVKKGFIKSEALRLLRTNSPKRIFEDQIRNLKSRVQERGYP